MGLSDFFKKLLGKGKVQAPPPQPPAATELSEKDLKAVAGGRQQPGPNDTDREQVDVKPPYP